MSQLNTSHVSRSIVAYSFLMVIGLLFFLSSTGCKQEADKTISPSKEMAMLPLQTDNINQDAVNILKRGMNYLSNLNKFTVTTQNTLEDVINENLRIDFETASNLTVVRPNKVRIERYGLEMHQLFFFNGKRFTLHNPYDKVYASKSLKGSLEDMFHVARDSFGLSAPSSDLIYANSFDLLAQNIEVAQVIGKEMIGNNMCDHLLFVRPNVSFQIWISQSAPYLPHKYVVTDTSTPHLLSFSTLMTEWKLDATVSDSMFEYSPSEDVHQIEFIKISEPPQ